MRSLRVRIYRGQVVVTGGGVPIAMTADEARAFARAVVATADEADPIQGDRAFGEDLVEDVPAQTVTRSAPMPSFTPSRFDPAARHLADLNAMLARARAKGCENAVLSVIADASESGYDLRPGADVFTPIGKAPRDTFPRIGVPVDVRAGAINLVDVDR